MATVEKSIEVDVPVSTAYNQWTQFEEFPQFMDGVSAVKQLDDKHLHWTAEIGGKEEQWEAEITSQVPDEKIAWRSVSGAENTGIVTFTPIDQGRTQVHLRIEYKPEGFIETVGDMLGSVSRSVEGDLERFKSFIEARRTESGEWRGHIHAGEVKSESEASANPMNTEKRAWAEEMRVEGESEAKAEGSDDRARTGAPSIDPTDGSDQRLTTP
ncbi:MAG: SRPBCC family protein [Candidatus Kapaibacterium sp.]